MAINPNIALGVQPVQQQPNMLAQYAQVMAIKAAQQEMEGNEGIRGALSQGIPDDPTTLLQYGKQGRATYESLLKGKKEQIDSAAKTLTMAGQIAGYVRDNPTPENFVSAVGTMVQSGVLTRAQAERVIADAGNDPTKIKSYAERTASDALTEADRLTARTRIQAANIGAGPGYQRNALEREKYEYERANPTLSRVDGENGFYLYNPRDPNSAVPLGMRPTAPPAAPVAQPSAVNNMLITPGVAQPSVNALTQPSPNQAGPTVAAANALNQQPTIIRPKQPFRAPVPAMVDGKPVLVAADKAIGLPPATADAEKAARLQAQQVRDLDVTIRNLADITKPGGLISQSTGSGIGRAYDVAAGFVGNAPEGAIAAAKLAPIADMVLKMVPRFEGPQSDKDTQSYKEAAGQLANPNLPTKIRQEAGKEILRLMKERKNQFVSTDMAREGFGATTGGSSGGAPADPLGIR